MEFGLYVDPLVLTQRHTLYDSDEDEAENEEEKVTISITDSEVSVTEGGVLLVAVGVTASIFAQSYPILMERDTCSIVANSKAVLKDTYFPPTGGGQVGKKTVCDELFCLSKVFAVQSEGTGDGGSSFVCVHEKPLKPEYCNTWASKVFERLRPSTVVVLTSRVSQEHFSPHNARTDACYIMRCLQTSSWSHPPLVPTFLEPPNTIAGEAAAILTHCQLNKLPAAMAVLYADSTVSTNESMGALQTVLKHPLLSENLSLAPTDKALQKAKQLTPKPRHDLSTLYT